MISESALFDSVPPAVAAGVIAAYILLLAAGTVAAVLTLRVALRRGFPWEACGQAIRNRAVSGRDGLAVTGIVIVLLLATWYTATWLRHPAPALLLILQGIGLDLLGLGALAWYLHHRGRVWNEALGLHWQAFPASFRPGIIFYLSVLPFVFFSSLVYQGLLSANGYPPSLQDVALLLTADHPLWMRIYMLFMACVLAPAFEESLFRGVLFPLFARRLGIGSGVFLSSLIFAAIHCHTPSLVPLCVVATGFSLAYLVTGSLWVPIIMHGLFNGVNLALLLALRQ